MIGEPAYPRGRRGIEEAHRPHPKPMGWMSHPIQEVRAATEEPRAYEPRRGPGARLGVRGWPRLPGLGSHWDPRLGEPSLRPPGLVVLGERGSEPHLPPWEGVWVSDDPGLPGEGRAAPGCPTRPRGLPQAPGL